MRHDFLDKHSHISSPVHSLDPRVKTVVVFSAIIIIVTEPLDGHLLRFTLYTAMVIAVAALSRVPPLYIMKRLLVVLPFILMAALFYPLSVYYSNSEELTTSREMLAGAGLTILMKSVLAVFLLILLSSTERFHRLLLALRRLKVPSIVTTISALLYRYIFLLVDETLKTTRARDSRTPGRLTISKAGVYGNQVAVIFLRSWERAQVIYKSMLSRGFSGDFPDMQSLKLTVADVVLPFLFIVLLLAVRILI